MSNLADIQLAVQAPAPAERSAKAPARLIVIRGVTVKGHAFRPSDWAERLCGVMSCYRPGGIATGRDAYIGYSPYVRPVTIAAVKCVIVDERLQDIEPMALKFVLNFAKDNELAVEEGSEAPDAAERGQA